MVLELSSLQEASRDKETFGENNCGSKKEEIRSRDKSYNDTKQTMQLREKTTQVPLFVPKSEYGHNPNSSEKPRKSTRNNRHVPIVASFSSFLRYTFYCCYNVSYFLL